MSRCLPALAVAGFIAGAATLLLGSIAIVHFLVPGVSYDWVIRCLNWSPAIGLTSVAMVASAALFVMPPEEIIAHRRIVWAIRINLFSLLLCAAVWAERERTSRSLGGLAPIDSSRIKEREDWRQRQSHGVDPIELTLASP